VRYLAGKGQVQMSRIASAAILSGMTMSQGVWLVKHRPLKRSVSSGFENRTTAPGFLRRI
jgi:hypothetical protein